MCIYIYTPWKFKKWTRSVFSKWDPFLKRPMIFADHSCFFLQGHFIVCWLIGCQSRQPWQISDLHLKHWSAAWPFVDEKLSSHCNYIGNYRDYNKPWKKDPEINQLDPISPLGILPLSLLVKPLSGFSPQIFCHRPAGRQFNISGSGLQAGDYMTAIHVTDRCSGLFGPDLFDVFATPCLLRECFLPTLQSTRKITCMRKNARKTWG